MYILNFLVSTVNLINCSHHVLLIRTYAIDIIFIISYWPIVMVKSCMDGTWSIVIWQEYWFIIPNGFDHRYYKTVHGLQLLSHLCLNNPPPTTTNMNSKLVSKVYLYLMYYKNFTVKFMKYFFAWICFIINVKKYPRRGPLCS